MSKLLIPRTTALVFAASFLTASLSVSLSASLWAQQEVPSAPVPPLVSEAKRAFISNAGEESDFELAKDAWYSGGPYRTYNQFYAALKSWGRYELVAAPADADVVFEIGFLDRSYGTARLSQMKVVALDPKTRITLWTFTKYVEFAGSSKNREKNYNQAMSSLMDDIKSVVSPPGAASK